MWPIFSNIRGYEIGSYGVLLAIAVMAGLWTARRLGKRDNLDPQTVNDIGLGTIVIAVISSKLLGVAVDYLNDIPLTWAELRNAGAVHGGVFGGLVAATLFAKYNKIPLGKLLDAYLPAGALGQSIGRLGCLAAGCCFGTHSDAPWAITFTNPRANSLGGVPLHVGLHPVQLYDAGVHLVIFVGLVILHRRKLFVGRLFGIWAILEGLARLSVENFRGDLGRGVWFEISWLSTGRITSLAIVAIGCIFLLIKRTKPTNL